MSLYRLLRQLARVALDWFYADVVVQGRERLPRSGPLLIVANHPNALVDAMVVAVAAPRRVLLTAKATLFERPLLALLLRTVGVVPLRRAKDEHASLTGAQSPAARNADAFRKVTAALAGNEAVLVFPEGISHDAPTLAPLRTGAARMALMAHDSGVKTLHIVAVGLIYEQKERPRSRVLVRVGEPIALDAWAASHAGDAMLLTDELNARLRDVTLNFATEARARRAVQLARTLNALAGEVPSVGYPRALGPEADIAHRIDTASDALIHAPESVLRRADAFIASVETFKERLAARGIRLSELRVSPHVRHGAWFVIRESLVLAVTLPVALVDRVAHDFPVRLARAFARRSFVRDSSRDQPAMRTIVAAAGLLLAWYLVLGAALDHWFGAGVALLALAIMALSASAELALRGRMARAARRARTYLALRADPALRSSALAEADQLVDEALALEHVLAATGSATPVER